LSALRRSTTAVVEYLTRAIPYGLVGLSVISLPPRLQRFQRWTQSQSHPLRTILSMLAYTAQEGYRLHHCFRPLPRLLRDRRKIRTFRSRYDTYLARGVLVDFGAIGLWSTPGATHTLLSQLHASPCDALALAWDVRAPFARHAFRHVLRERGRESAALG